MQLRISNVPFLHKADGIYESRTKSHFKLNDAASTSVIQPNTTHLTLQKNNFKMCEDRFADFKTNYSDFKTLPMSKAKLVRPTTSVKTSMPEGKYPEPTYKSHYTNHGSSPILKAKEEGKTGVSSSLNQEKNDQFGSSHHEHFQYIWCPPFRPLESIEKQHVQYSSIPMGDQEKAPDRQTTYSTSFRQAALSPAKVKECLLPSIKKYWPVNLREISDDEWITTSREEFRAHKCGPIHLESRDRNLSYVLKGDMLQGNQEPLVTTNQSFFPEINHTQFPVYVDGPSIRTLSDVQFGRPDLTGNFYSITSQEHFKPKEVIRPKPPVYPPSYVLYEQEPDRMLTTMQKDFIPLNARRQKLSPSQLQQVKDCHIKPRHNKHDFRTTHKETFVPKPYCKPTPINPVLRNISHMPF